jgi:hypothetical protein
MTLITEVITFTLDSSLGTGQQIVRLANGQLQPKCGILLCSKNTADGITPDVNVAIGMFDEDLTQRCWSINSEDGGTSTDTRARYSNNENIISIVDNDGSLDFVANIIEIGSGFITFDLTNIPSADYRLHMLLLGGDDITNTDLRTVAAPASPAVQDYTAVGFEPKVVIFAATGYTGTQSQAGLCFGFMTTDGEQGTTAIQSEDFVGVTNTLRRQSASRCLSIFRIADSVTEAEAAFNGMLSNGFSLDFSIAGASVSFGALSIAGNFNVKGSSFLNTTQGTVTQETGFEPNAAIFSSFILGATGGAVATLAMSLGIVDEEGIGASIGSVSEDGVAAINGHSWEETDGSVYTNYFHDTLKYDELEFLSWNEDGFSLEQVDRDPSANDAQILWLAFGSSESEVPSVKTVPDQNPCR